MKNIFILLLIVFNIQYNPAQDCIDLNIQEHISGDPVCWLKKGDKVEICLLSETINANNCNFFLLNKKYNSFGNLIYEFGIDRNNDSFIAPVYGRLIVNPLTNVLIFRINDRDGVFKYKNKNKSLSNLISDDKNPVASKSDKIQESTYEDKIIEINKHIKNNEYEEAHKKYNKLWSQYSW